jgi:hypothetical protein
VPAPGNVGEGGFTLPSRVFDMLGSIFTGLWLRYISLVYFPQGLSLSLIRILHVGLTEKDIVRKRNPLIKLSGLCERVAQCS